jgi:hypothetical protein
MREIIVYGMGAFVILAKLPFVISWIAVNWVLVVNFHL